MATGQRSAAQAGRRRKTRAPGRPYLVAAANILHYEVFATDEAIALYERALDENPLDIKTFERLDKILSTKHAWRDKARAYQRMIKRLGPADDEQKKASLLTLWRGLAELCRTELDDLPTAAAALEVCVKLDPSSLGEQEALAELYEATGPEGLRAAVDRRSYLFERHDDPDRHDPPAQGPAADLHRGRACPIGPTAPAPPSP